VDIETVMDKIHPGLIGEKSVTATEDLSARSMASGGIDVYATPAMVALMEAAALAAIDPLLPEGHASVGISLNIKHIAATPIGHTVRARAEVVEVDGRRVLFNITAWDEKEMIGEGEHTRVVIEVERFMRKVNSK
jgi:predicted thioesterase